ncbi:MAG: NCS2 family permease [Candidatus Omnitrophica bacterium]|nr:NCS2 family permease [Candidatus Omnitrophota bacterium]
MTQIIQNFFHFKDLGTNIRTETVAGLTTFMTMAYIIFVNSAMISQTGMDLGSAMMATCISSAIATLLMGLWVNYPIALAPGMGENAFFTYTVCLTMGISWQVALGCVFIQGILFILLTLTRARQALFDAIPVSLRHGIACGIGLLITFVGLIDSGLIVSHPATFVTLGDILNPATLLALFGLMLTGVLLVKKVRGAILWGILITAVMGIPFGVVRYEGLVSLPPSMAPTFMKMDILGAMKLGLVSIVFVFLFMSVFDTVGTLAGIGEVGGFIKDGRLPRVGKAMFADAVSTCVGAVCGTPTVTSYIESASGITAGGRSGFANVITGLLFVAAIFFYPLIKMIGGGFRTETDFLLHPVTAPALILVGCMIMETVSKIEWKNYEESIPAFMVIIMMPLTFSIATAIALGFISYCALKLLTGKGREVPWFVYLLSGLFILRFIYLKAL